MKKLLLEALAGLTLVSGAMVMAGAALGTGASEAAAMSLGENAGTGSATRSAFCSANDELDRATANISSLAQVVPILRANQNLVNELAHNLPAGQIGNEAQKVVQAARTVIRTGSPNVLNGQAFQNGTTDMNVYCRVDGNGNALPPYYDTGKATALCRKGAAVANDVAPSQPSASLAFLKSHQNDVSTFAGNLSSLPKNLRADGQEAVKDMQDAISSGSASTLETHAFDAAAVAISDYCGFTS